MAVNTTWTDPSTGGTIDLNTGGILTETIWDAVLSNIKRLGGTDGDTKTGILSLLGGQLVFPATQAASTGVNTLDDYEEGSWTPVLTFVTAGNLSVVYSAQVGRYIKIGRLVHLFCDISTSTFTHTTASGDMQVTGLPFTTQTLTNYIPMGPLSFEGITWTNYTNFVFRTDSNVTYLTVQASGSGQSTSTVTTGQMPTGGTVRLWGHIAYMAAD